MTDWYYGKDNAQHGPVSNLEIKSLISSGQIDTDTIIWREGMSDWLPIKEVREFQPSEGNTAHDTNFPQTNAGQGPHTGAPSTNGMAIASLILGILAIVSCYVWALFGIPAVICGHISLKKIKNSRSPIQGKGMAITGLILGYIGILLQLIAIIGVVYMIGSVANPSPSYGP